MKPFLYHYLRSMRLYYCFVTGTTVLWGLAWAFSTSPQPLPFRQLRGAAALFVGFLAWGVNQIFSDYCDRKEDAINAPHRPMVTGALAPLPAMALSACFMVLFAVVSLCMNPWTLVPLAMGGVLNIAYSLLKKVPVVNCFVYACSISCCACYGYAAVNRNLPPLHAWKSIAFYVLPVHMLMCHNSYYKDRIGDKATGIRTLQTLFPPAVSYTVSILLSLTVMTSGIHAIRPLPWLAWLQTGLFLLLLIRFLCEHAAMNLHAATKLNCQFCVAALYPFVLSCHPWLLACELLSLLVIHLLFSWYRDEKE